MTDDEIQSEVGDLIVDLGLPPPDAVGLEITGELGYWAYYRLSRSRSHSPRVYVPPGNETRPAEKQIGYIMAWYRRVFPDAPLNVRWATEYPPGCNPSTRCGYRSVVDWQEGKLRMIAQPQTAVYA